MECWIQDIKLRYLDYRIVTEFYYMIRTAQRGFFITPELQNSITPKPLYWQRVFKAPFQGA